MPLSPSFWRWLLTTAGTLLGEAIFEALFGGHEDDAAKTKKMERRR